MKKYVMVQTKGNYSTSINGGIVAMKRRIIFCILAVAMIFTLSSAALASASDGQVRVLLDGRQLTFDVPPQIINGRTLVPMRALFQELGAAIDWNAATQTVTAVKGNSTVVLKIGSNSPTINGVAMQIDQPGVIVGGRTLVPLRFVAEALGVRVDWDAKASTVSIRTAPSGGGGGGAAFPGKIAIVTNDLDYYEEEYQSAGAYVAKYGADKIVHKVWPVNSFIEPEKMIAILLEIAADPDVKAVIINQATTNTNAAVDKLLEVRPDVFVAYCQPAENAPDIASRAHLSVDTNELLRGERIVAQAKAMGAKTFVHYSFPRHLSVPFISQRRDAMKAACEREGMMFVDLTATDPMSDVGIPGAQQFILEDVPKQVAQWGRDTAFFSTNCTVQIPLIIRVIEERAIYPEPCCPSPYHGFPTALGIAHKIYDQRYMSINDYGDLVDMGRLRRPGEVLEEMRTVIKIKGAGGRLATWPSPGSTLFTVACTEYAIKWINGEVPKEKGNVDYAAFEQICEDYIYEIIGERLGVEIHPLSHSGRVYNNCLMLVMDSFVF